MTTAFITGANRGIGLEFVKQLTQRGMNVFASCRDPDNAAELKAIAQEHSTISICTLDVTQQDQIEKLAQQLAEQPIDWLINNAGMSGEQGVTIGHIDRDNFLNVMNTNCLSALKVSEAFLPQLKLSKGKLIVVISSRMGSISDNDSGGSYAYRASKAALNCVMHSLAIDIAAQDMGVLLLHPGWVKTRLGGEGAYINVTTSVSGLLQQIDKYKDTAHAQAMYKFDGDKIPW